jgi:hypothetical protein
MINVDGYVPVVCRISIELGSGYRSDRLGLVDAFSSGHKLISFVMNFMCRGIDRRATARRRTVRSGQDLDWRGRQAVRKIRVTEQELRQVRAKLRALIG